MMGLATSPFSLSRMLKKTRQPANDKQRVLASAFSGYVLAPSMRLLYSNNSLLCRLPVSSRVIVPSAVSHDAW